MKNKLFIVSLTVIILLLVLGFILLQNRDKTNILSSGVVWNNEEISQTEEVDYISLPCFNAMNFSANSLLQDVDIYNPKANRCAMNFVLEIGDVVVWSAENVKPNYGFHKIKIANPIPQGIYDARLIINCHDIDTLEELNGGIIEFKLYSD